MVYSYLTEMPILVFTSRVISLSRGTSSATLSFLPTSKHQRSSQLYYFACCHSFPCLLCSAVSMSHFIPETLCVFFFFSFFSSLCLGAQMCRLVLGSLMKTCFCKCALPQLYSKKEEIKNNFLSIPDVTYIPGGKCALTLI